MNWVRVVECLCPIRMYIYNLFLICVILYSLTGEHDVSSNVIRVNPCIELCVFLETNLQGKLC
jgi:hypothetical protein